jgi:hypothetical protein
MSTPSQIMPVSYAEPDGPRVRYTLSAGALDRSDELDVVAHIWTKRKQAWIGTPDGVRTWPEGAPPTEFVEAIHQLSSPRLLQ